MLAGGQVLGAPEADGARAYEHVRKLAEEIGPRVAGSNGERMARDYIAAELQRYGYDVTLEDFPFDASAFLPSRIDVGAYALPAYAFKGSSAGIVTAPMIDAGTGRAEDYPT